MSIQQIRANAKKAVHDFFSVAVVYTPFDVGVAPFETTARIHMGDKPVEGGEWSTNGFATMIEQAEYLIFNAGEVTPMHGDKITTVADGIDYWIERSLKPFDGYVKCEVVTR